MAKNELRVVPKRNYILLAIIFIISMLILYYFYLWTIAYKDRKLNVRVMDSYMDVLNYNELDNFLVESPNTILYVSILEDSKIRDFEKKLRKEFRNGKISNNVIYMDVTDKDSKGNELFSKYNTSKYNIGGLPYILVFENGIIGNVYNIKNNGYDVNSVETFINSISFLEEIDLDD